MGSAAQAIDSLQQFVCAHEAQAVVPYGTPHTLALVSAPWVPGRPMICRQDTRTAAVQKSAASPTGSHLYRTTGASIPAGRATTLPKAAPRRLNYTPARTVATLTCSPGRLDVGSRHFRFDRVGAEEEASVVRRFVEQAREYLRMGLLSGEPTLRRRSSARPRFWRTCRETGHEGAWRRRPRKKPWRPREARASRTWRREHLHRRDDPSLNNDVDLA